jgi:hypothetical protein
MDKLNYMKPRLVQIRDSLRMSRNYRQHEYKDTLLDGSKKLPFSHEFYIMGHMHDLRMWTIAYAPMKHNNL